MKPLSHETFVKKSLSKSEVAKAYDQLSEEFMLLKQMINARKAAKKTQEELAKIMNTTTSVIGRLETGGGKNKHSPTIETLKRYADALDYKLVISFLPKHTAKKNY